MGKNKIIEEFFQQQQDILVRAAGEPYRAVRDIITALKAATRQIGVVLQQGQTDVRLQIPPDPDRMRRLCASWKNISEEGRIGLIDAIQTEVHPLIREQLLPVIAGDAGILLIVEKPEEVLAPLSAPPSDALKAAIESMRRTIDGDSEQSPVIHALIRSVNEQEFVAKEAPNDCIAALQELAREFPQFAPEIRSLYRTWITSATDLFSALRDPAAHITSQEEFVRFLVEVHIAVWGSVHAQCDKVQRSANLRDLAAQCVLSSVAQSLTIARIFGRDDADQLFPMMPEEIRSIGELPTQKQDALRQRYREAAALWEDLAHTWDAMRQGMAARVQQCPAHVAHSGSVLQSLQNSLIGIQWLNSLCRDADNTSITRSDAPLEDGVAREDVPKFSAMTMGKTMFTEHGDVDEVKARDIYGDGRIIRRVVHEPCGLPELWINHSAQDTQSRPLYCWLCLQESGISAAHSIIPFSVICGDRKTPTTERLSAFLQSMDRSGRAAIRNLAACDPLLAERFGEIAASGKSLLIFHDSQFFAVLAPRILAKGCLAESAIIDEAAQSVVAMVCAADERIPGTREPLVDPAIVGWTANFEALEEETDDRGKLQRERIKQCIHSKKRWSADEVTELLRVARIVIAEKNKHWKVVGPSGSFPLPSAPLKDGKWRANLVAGMILAVGDLEAMEQWMDTSVQRKAGNSR